MDRAPAKQGHDSRVHGTEGRCLGGPRRVTPFYRRCHLFRRQRLDQTGNAYAGLRVAPPWGKFTEWQKNEGPRSKTRVRQHRTCTGFADTSVVVQQIEIQNSRRVGCPSNPTEIGFDFMKDLHQARRRQGRDHLGDAVDKPRLIGLRDGRASIPARPARHPDPLFLQSPKGSLTGAHRRPMLEMREVGPDSDVDHGNSAEFTRTYPSRDGPCQDRRTP